MKDDDFFIGWAETPKVDRRYFVRTGVGLMAATTIVAGSIAAFQRSAGPGKHDLHVHEWRGIVTADPYAMLRMYDEDGAQRTVLLSCQGKCGVSAKIGNLAGKPVVVKGSLIKRGRHKMIAVIDGVDWIREDRDAEVGDLTFPTLEPIMDISLNGEVLDTKCWFGTMRPSNGKVHKSCASLCIRGGIPPAFYVKDPRDQSALMIMTSGGGAYSADILPFVADPVAITGKIQRYGDLLFLDAPVSAIRRL